MKLGLETGPPDVKRFGNRIHLKENKFGMINLHVKPSIWVVAMGVRRNFSRGGNVDISRILFEIANDAMQMDLHKMLYPFYTAGP